MQKKITKSRALRAPNNKLRDIGISFTLFLLLLITISSIILMKKNYFSSSYKREIVFPLHQKSDKIVASKSSDLCNYNLTIPTNYNKQVPLNPFYGITLFEGQGKVCDVLLGPNYKSGYEGFSGEQIQINVYDRSKTDLEEIYKTDRAYDIDKSNNQIQYKQPSYGGVNTCILIAKEEVIYKIIWRNNENSIDIDETALEIANELIASN